MNILIISQYFWPENFRINDLAIKLNKKGHKVSVLTAIPNYPEGNFYKGYGFFNKHVEYYNDIKIIRVPIIPRFNAKKWQLLINYISFVISSVIAIPFFFKEKYDLIFVFEVSPITVAIPAIFLSKLKKIPLYLWVLDLWPESLSSTNTINNSFLLKTCSKFVSWIYKNCTKILVTSKGYIKSIMLHSINENKILYFPNFVEDSFLIPPKNSFYPLELQNIPKGFWIMFAGNIGVSQDFPTILEAVKNLRDNLMIHWIIIGNGRMFDWVKNEIKNNNLESIVHLLGSFEQDKMPYFFKYADTLLVSLKKSPIFSLTIPGKVQSYMACGKPIIAMLEGEGASLIIESNSGLTTPPENAKALSETVLKMLGLSEMERQNMGISGKKFCETNFSQDKLVSNLENWMQEDI